MDADLNDPTWGELGELFSKDCSSSSAIDAFQVQLNGELVVPVADLPLPTVTLSEHPVRLDAALNPVQVTDEGERMPSPTAMEIEADSKPEEESIIAVTPSCEQATVRPIDKSEPNPAIFSPVSPSAPAAASAAAATLLTAHFGPKAEPMVAPASAACTPPGPAEGRVEKRPIGSLKEKREREAKQFPRNLLSNLDGTTSAEVRKMSAKERELVLYKRKLRNRESARRSRQKRQATLAELQEEIGDLLHVAGSMVDAGLALRAENGALREQLDLVQAQVRALRAVYPTTPPPSGARMRGAGASGTPPAAEPVAAPKVAAAEDSPLKMKMGG